jgi:hypothetical protein
MADDQVDASDRPPMNGARRCEPQCALTAEVEREGHADSTIRPDIATMSAR